MAIRSRNIYTPNQEKPFKLSRSKVDSYLNCKKCFYIDRRLGVGQPPGFLLTLIQQSMNYLKKKNLIFFEMRLQHILIWLKLART